ncbi:MAG TPA: ferrous iron transport protein B [Chitinispirillaceae bacterium]|nr:ferrous iron transport protein B [Chitinispirillaceae bacterium]
MSVVQSEKQNEIKENKGIKEPASNGREVISVALMGNPNSGKTSLFNTLTGSHQHVGNYAGVTVDIKEGETEHKGVSLSITDLPGTYSLTAYSMEERVARDFLLNSRPDVVVNVLDATNLERNLYLTIQMLELGIRPILALNMWDEVGEKGIKIEMKKLYELLELPVIETVGKTGENTGKLLDLILENASVKKTVLRKKVVEYPPELQKIIEKYSVGPAVIACGYTTQWVVLKLLENDKQLILEVKRYKDGERLIAAIIDDAAKIQQLLGEDTESLIAEARYGFIAGLLKEIQIKTVRNRIEISDQLDKVLTHPVWAFPVFFLFMWLLFQATFVVGQYPQALLEHGVELLARVAKNLMPASLLRDCIVEGAIGGVGGVVVFLPNILILFFGIAIMEDTGYMARAAFITDKIMHRVGLHGKSFIPMIMGMGCNVPAIMAARTLESDTDRKKTILLSPLVSCSARLPVYVLFAGALFPRHAGNVIFLFQFVLGTLSFFVMAWIFRKTIFRGESQPFVMELPPYRLPTFKSVVIHMWQRAAHFLQKMGGVVLLFTVLLWFLSEFPKDNSIEQKYQKELLSVDNGNFSVFEKERFKEEITAKLKTEQMSQSYIGRAGLFMEPVFKPLGFDWRAVIAIVTGFVAKEVVVSSLGVLYGAENGGVVDKEILNRKIADNFTPLSAISFMLFVLLYTPCIVALITQIRELKSLGWTLFSITYQPLFAWIVALIIFQTGRLLGIR